MQTETVAHRVITMDSVESSQIAAIGHDGASNTLSVQFTSKTGGAGSIYHYANFDAEAFAAFKNAESIGSYFYKNIKPHAEKYPYVKVS